MVEIEVRYEIRCVRPRSLSEVRGAPRRDEQGSVDGPPGMPRGSYLSFKTTTRFAERKHFRHGYFLVN